MREGRDAAKSPNRPRTGRAGNAWLGVALLALAAGLTQPVSAAAQAPLYDQMDGLSTYLTASDELATRLAADDFAVPTGRVWQIGRVEATGSFWDYPDIAGTDAPSASVPAKLDGFRVRFFDGSGQTPARELASHRVSDPSHGTNPHARLLTLNHPPVVLGPGRRWLSIQSRLPFEEGGGSWYWSMRAPARGAVAAWREEVDASGTGCTVFRPYDQCFDTEPGMDQAFRLVGRSAPAKLAVVGARRAGKRHARLQVNAPNVGKLRLRAAKGSPVRGASKGVRSIGRSALRVRLTAKARRSLARGRRAKGKVRLSLPKREGRRVAATRRISIKP